MALLSISRDEWATTRPTRRTLAQGAVFVWGWFILGNFRTSHFGESFFSILFYLVGGAAFVLLPAAVAHYNGDIEQTARRAARFTAIIIFAAMLWANTEELFVRSQYNRTCIARTGQQCVELLDSHSRRNEVIVYNRLWPFNHHDIIYRPESGWKGTD